MYVMGYWQRLTHDTQNLSFLKFSFKLLENYLKKLILNCTKTIYVFKKLSYSVVKECYACILQQPKQNS